MRSPESEQRAFDAFEAALVHDARAAQVERSPEFAQRVLASLPERERARRVPRWAVPSAALVAATVALTFFLDPPTDPEPPLLALRSKVDVSEWVTSSTSALHQSVDLALLSEWNAIVTDASNAASSIVDGVVAPLRGFARLDSR